MIKPVATGFEARSAEQSDSGRLLLAQGLPLDAANLDATTPWRFGAPLSPDMAARRENRSLPFAELVAFCAQRHDVDLTLIEGIGGVMVPLEETADAVRQRLRDMPIIALPRTSAAREGIATLARLIVGARGSGFSRDSSKSRD
jgi:dethiobiotin synthetase